MKQFRILSHEQNIPVVINANSLEYTDYLYSGYFVFYEGNKKECEAMIELMKTDGALAD